VRRTATLIIGVALLGAGAVLTFAIDDSVRGIGVSTIGLLLAVLGALVAVASLLAHASAAVARGHDGEERVRHLHVPPNGGRSAGGDRWPDEAGPPR
jgi:hypothetical protein